jgi:hypothetical protein
MNNPARRLHNIISGLKDQPKTPVDQAFAKVLNVDPENYPLLMKRVGLVFLLLDAIEYAVKRLEGVNHEKYLLPVINIGKNLRGINFGQIVLHTTIATISEGTMAYLDMTAEYLNHHSPEPTITEESRKKILDSIFDFSKEVEGETGIPEKLREYIFDKLDLLRQAVEVYDICGANPVKEACESIGGGMIFQYYEYKEHEKSKQLMGKLLKCAIAAYCLIKFVNNIGALPESLKAITGLLGIGN